LIEGWCKKKLVFARPLLPFGTVGEANARSSTFGFCRHTKPTLEKPKELALPHR